MALESKRMLYRSIVLSVATLLAFDGCGRQFNYTINANYFPHQTPRSDLLWAYVAYGVAILLLLEGVFLFIFRRFTRAA